METEQYLKKIEEKLLAECERVGMRIPYIPENGRYPETKEKDPYQWTNGFFAGMLWQLYHATGNEGYRETAERSEVMMEEAMQGYEGLMHDVGFLYLPTSVTNYRLTGKQRSRVLGLHAANILAGRFNPAGGFIRAWNGEERTGYMIIDCLMNLPLLYWASEELKDPRYRQIAKLHTDTALRVLLRPDGSCHHIADFDPESGEVLSYPKGQGYETGSSWSRGQGWAVYGFALAYRYLKEEKYLNAAKNAAHYAIANLCRTNWIALCDFRQPENPDIRDTTASAVIACGLLELSELVGEREGALYRSYAETILEQLLFTQCDFAKDTDGILLNGTVAYGREASEVHVPIIYGDYYLVEGILRLRGEAINIW